MINKKLKLNPYLLLVLSFLGIVLLGSFLLSMPFVFKGNTNNRWCYNSTYLDALFTSLAAMSLTGVTTYQNGLKDTLTVGGQIIVLVLIQIGGLGIVTILTFLFTLFRSKLQFKDRLMISQAIAFNNFGEIVKYVRRLIVISAICEVVGFGLGVPVFYALFPNDWGHIIYYSLFHSVSAFNNTGFDLFSVNSASYSLVNGLIVSETQMIGLDNWLYYYFAIYITVLSLLGGISFLVIIDIFTGRRPPRRWSSFTKIVLVSTGVLVVGMSFLLFLSEGFKGEGSMTLFQSFFQVLNCRTAGFTIYDQNNLTISGKIICCLMMFIGGSPLSTSGGVKITTMFIIIVSIVSYFRGRRLAPFKRRFSESIIAKSMSLVYIVVFLLSFSFIAIVSLEGKNHTVDNDLTVSYLYEVFSCFGNVGFYTGLESQLTIGSKLIMCLLMLVGHLGPITFFQIFQNNLDKKANVHYSFVEEDFLIG